MTSLEKALKVTKAVEQGKELRSQLPAEAEEPLAQGAASKSGAKKPLGVAVGVAVIVAVAAAGLTWYFLPRSAGADVVAPVAQAGASVAPPVASAPPVAGPVAATPAVSAPPVAAGPVAPSAAPAVAAGASQPTPELQAVADGLAVGGIALIGGTPRVLINGAICLEGNFPKGVANLRLESVSEHELVFTGPGGEHYRRRF